MGLASALGLEGLTIGKLADELKLSKSGLFAHFQSKEALQIQVLDAAAEKFVKIVVRPAIGEKSGLPRLRALFDRWIAWSKRSEFEGGCVFLSAAGELDDRPGPVRDRLVELQKTWVDTITRVVQTCLDSSEFRGDVDVKRFAQDLFGLRLSYHFYSRLLRDPKAEARAKASFEEMIRAASP
jgi:AcrR family transcriptional regulator